MSYIPTIEEARELLKKFNADPFHLKHGEIVGGVLGYFAKEYDPERVEFWTVVGLLHDLDFEQFPEEHCIKQQELMSEAGLDPEIIHATCSHGYDGEKLTVKPENRMEQLLFACDELTGLIGACALMRPSKSVDDMELKSIKKKFKTPAFAAGCSREIITQGAEMLGWELDDLMSRTLSAMKTLNPAAGI